MASHPPLPLHFRGAVLLAALAFLVGVAGIFWFERAEQQALEAARSAEARVQVHGLEVFDDIEVRASWIDVEGIARQEVGEVHDRPARWIFREAPRPEPVELEVVRTAPDGVATVLHATSALLLPGQTFQVWLRGER